MKIIYQKVINKALTCMLVFSMITTFMPISVYATEDAFTSDKQNSDEIIEIIHSEECQFQEEVVGHECTYVHVHDEDCGYVESKDEIPCDKECIDTDGDGVIDHKEDCAYTPAIVGSPCTDVHEHDETCGYVEAVEGKNCTCGAITYENNISQADNNSLIMENNEMASLSAVVIDYSQLFIMSNTTIIGFDTDYLDSIGIGKNSEGDYELGDIEIPKDVTQIGNGSGYSTNASSISISKLSFEEGSLLTKVAKYGFQGVLINEIDFTNAIQLSEIGTQGFYQSEVTNITWSSTDALKTLESNAFNGNKISGELFEIPEGVQTINGAAFDGIDVNVLIFPSTIEHLESSTFQGVTSDWCVFEFDANVTTIPNGSTNNDVSITNTLVKDKDSYDYVMSMNSGATYLKPTYEATLSFDGITGDGATKQVLYNRPINWKENSDGITWSADTSYTLPTFTGDNNRWVISDTVNDEIVVTDIVAWDTLYQFAYEYTHYDYLWFGEYQQNLIVQKMTDEKPQEVIDAEVAGKEVVYVKLNDTDHRWYTIDPILWKIFKTVDNGDGTTTYTAVSEYTLAFAQMDSDSNAATFTDSDLWNNWFEDEIYGFNNTAFDKNAFADELFTDAGFNDDEWSWFKISTGLLSANDMFTRGYFPNEEDKLTTTTDYCSYPISFGGTGSTYTSYQWFETFYSSSGFGTRNYALKNTAELTSIYQNSIAGVRPMMQLTIDSKYNILENEGTKDDPYKIGTVTNKVSFICDDETTFDDQELIYGLKASRPEELIKDGYTLDGWYIDNDFTTKWDFEKNNVISDVTLYAQWKKDEESTIIPTTPTTPTAPTTTITPHENPNTGIHAVGE
ncbi:MAG: leucine-rich repeat protein [Erysipelotrichaceae bacterium]